MYLFSLWLVRKKNLVVKKNLNFKMGVEGELFKLKVNLNKLNFEIFIEILYKESWKFKYYIVIYKK